MIDSVNVEYHQKASDVRDVLSFQLTEEERKHKGEGRTVKQNKKKKKEKMVKAEQQMIAHRLIGMNNGTYNHRRYIRLIIFN